MQNLLSKLQNKSLVVNLLKLATSSYLVAILGIVFSTYYINKLGSSAFGEYVLHVNYIAILSLLGSFGLGVNFIAQLKNNSIRFLDLTAYALISFLAVLLMEIVYLSLFRTFNLQLLFFALIIALYVPMSILNTIRLSQTLRHSLIAKQNFYTNFLFFIVATSMVYSAHTPIEIFIAKVVIDFCSALCIFVWVNRSSFHHLSSIKEICLTSYQKLKNLFLEEKLFYMSINSLFLKVFDSFVPILLAKFGSYSLLAYFNLAQKILSQCLVLFSYLQNLLLSHYDKFSLVERFEKYKKQLILLSITLFILLVIIQFFYFSFCVKETLDIYFYISLVLFSASILTYPYRNIISSILISNSHYKVYFNNNVMVTLVNIILFSIVILCNRLTLFNVALIFVTLQIISTWLLYKAYFRYIKVGY